MAEPLGVLRAQGGIGLRRDRLGQPEQGALAARAGRARSVGTGYTTHSTPRCPPAVLLRAAARRAFPLARRGGRAFICPAADRAAYQAAARALPLLCPCRARRTV